MVFIFIFWWGQVLSGASFCFSFWPPFLFLHIRTTDTHHTTHCSISQTFQTFQTIIVPAKLSVFPSPVLSSLSSSFFHGDHLFLRLGPLSDHEHSQTPHTHTSPSPPTHHSAYIVDTLLVVGRTPFDHVVNSSRIRRRGSIRRVVDYNISKYSIDTSDVTSV